MTPLQPNWSKRMKLMVVIAMLFLTTSCVAPGMREYQDWATTARPRAAAGQVKWSDYYKGLYARAQNLPPGFEGKAFALRGAATLIDASIAREEGRISQNDFESFQRRMQASAAEYQEQLRAKRKAEADAEYDRYLAREALEAQRFRRNNPIYCTSTRIGSTTEVRCN